MPDKARFFDVLKNGYISLIFALLFDLLVMLSPFWGNFYNAHTFMPIIIACVFIISFVYGIIARKSLSGKIGLSILGISFLLMEFYSMGNL